MYGQVRYIKRHTSYEVTERTCCRGLPVRQQQLSRGMSPMQLVRPQPDGTQPDEGQAIQKPVPLWPPLCWCRPHGDFRLPSAAALLQTTKSGLCRGQEEIFNHAHLSSTTPSVCRWATVYDKDNFNLHWLYSIKDIYLIMDMLKNYHTADSRNT